MDKYEKRKLSWSLGLVVFGILIFIYGAMFIVKDNVVCGWANAGKPEGMIAGNTLFAAFNLICILSEPILLFGVVIAGVGAWMFGDYLGLKTREYFGH